MVAPASWSSDAATEIGALADEAGLRRVHMLAWRDFDDPEAGGSEVHAERIATLWTRAGVDVTTRTSHAAGHPATTSRNGHTVIRKGGRYLVFPRAAISERLGRHGPSDGLVEIWNGMPFFAPLWARGPRIVFLHHFHAEMWDMTLPPHLARIGRAIESRIAPPIYRRTEVVTLSDSSKRELVEEMGLHASRVTVVPPGIEARFTPAGAKSPTPLIVGVGRLVPVKRFDRLINAAARVRAERPDLELVIAGEGYEREALEALRHEVDGESWIHLPGRVSDRDLVDLYRRAWVVASSSVREGWNMSLSEAAACGTPAVATRIAGHSDSVREGRSGLLVDSDQELVDALNRVIGEPRLRAELAAGALQHASELSWEATALGAMRVLTRDALRRGRGVPTPTRHR